MVKVNVSFRENVIFYVCVRSKSKMEKKTVWKCVSFLLKKINESCAILTKIILFPAYNVCKKIPEIVINLLKDMQDRVSNRI